MSTTTETAAGTVVSVRRYPVKSMMGEDLNASWITPNGLLGDRVFALVDTADGKIVSAKNPRKWPEMFHFHSAYTEPPKPGEASPPVRVTLPDGAIVDSREDHVNEILSKALGRPVKWESTAPAQPCLEEYWPDMQELDHQDTVTDENIAAGTFFDAAPVHLLTTATLGALRNAYPKGRFEARRFRPNIVIQPNAMEDGFVENDWIDHELAIGSDVRLRITGPCPRCVMTTLGQGDLPRDTEILRTAAGQNQAHVGVYATVIQGGLIRRGDVVRLGD